MALAHEPQRSFPDRAFWHRSNGQNPPGIAGPAGRKDPNSIRLSSWSSRKAEVFSGGGGSRQIEAFGGLCCRRYSCCAMLCIRVSHPGGVNLNFAAAATQPWPYLCCASSSWPIFTVFGLSFAVLGGDPEICKPGSLAATAATSCWELLLQMHLQPGLMHAMRLR